MLNCAAEKVIVNGFIKHKWMTKFHLIAPKVEMIQIIQKIEIFEQHSYQIKLVFCFVVLLTLLYFFHHGRNLGGKLMALNDGWLAHEIILHF